MGSEIQRCFVLFCFNSGEPSRNKDSFFWIERVAFSKCQLHVWGAGFAKSGDKDRESAFWDAPRSATETFVRMTDIDGHWYLQGADVGVLGPGSAFWASSLGPTSFLELLDAPSWSEMMALQYPWEQGSCPPHPQPIP